MVEVDRYERWFMMTTAVMLVLAGIALMITLVGHHAALPEPSGRIEPEAVRDTAPFDDPGLKQIGDNEYELVLVGQAWSWTPDEIEIPLGAEVDIVATTVDVTHGLSIPDTNANAMVIPGQVTRIEDIVFDEERRYTIICHEYCGLFHHQMGASITVG